MPRPSARFGVPAAALAVLAAALSAGCGSDGIEGTIPATNAQTLQQDLADVRAAVERGDCATATGDAEELKREVNKLPATAGTELKDALRAAVEHLIALTRDPTQCRPAATTTTTTTTTTGPSGESGFQPDTGGEETPPGQDGTPPGQEGQPPGHGGEGGGD